MKRCYGYVRVSTVKQGDGVSLEAQRDAIESFAAHHNITVTEWFEETVTAAKSGRPLFNKMVSQLKRRRADGVVFHKIDRSARNFADWARIGDLAEAGFDIHFATESLDFNSRGGRLTADIQAVIAADYVRNLREECIKGINGRLKQGLYPFRAPLGYLDNGGGKPKTIDPVRGRLVREMFQLYATGEFTHKTLIPEMAKRGLLSRNGKPLSQSSIEQTLLNPFYVGIIRVKTTGLMYQGIHEPLISMALFDAVNRVRTGRGHKISTRHNFKMRGLFRCGHCTEAMIAETKKGHVYYRCHNKDCPTKSIREEVLVQGIESFLKPISLCEEEILRLKNSIMAWVKQRNASKLMDQAVLELSQIDRLTSKLEDKFIDDRIDDATYNSKKAELLAERQRWQGILNQKKPKGWHAAKIDELLEQMKNLYTVYISASQQRQREIVKFATSDRLVLGKNVEITPSEWVTVVQNLLNSTQCPPSKGGSRTFRLLCKFLEVLE